MGIPDIFTVVFLGLVFGSFATALSYRLPRDLPILSMQRSHCPSCRKDLGAADLVPLFSWLFLRGRCRYCKASIGARYPLIELATLALCLVFYGVFGLSVGTLPVFALAPVVVSIIDIDFRHKIIPDSLNLSVLLIGVGLLLANAALDAAPAAFLGGKGVEAAAGAALYGAWALLLRQGALLALKREALGLGDVKFYGAAGFWLGLDAGVAALFMIVSGLCGVVLALIWKKRTGDAEVPFGPSLVMAFIAALLFHVPDFIHIH